MAVRIDHEARFGRRARSVEDLVGRIERRGRPGPGRDSGYLKPERPRDRPGVRILRRPRVPGGRSGWGPVATTMTSGSSSSRPSTSASRWSRPRHRGADRRLEVGGDLHDLLVERLTGGKPDLAAQAAGRSRSVTWCPRRAAISAALRPAGPPPTTTTWRASRLRVRRRSAYSRSWPAAGILDAPDALDLDDLVDAAVVAPDARPDLLGAPFGELPRQSRVRDQRRAMPIRSASPSSSIRSARSGCLIRPKATIGRLLTS